MKPEELASGDYDQTPPSWETQAVPAPAVEEAGAPRSPHTRTREAPAARPKPKAKPPKAQAPKASPVVQQQQPQPRPQPAAGSSRPNVSVPGGPVASIPATVRSADVRPSRPAGDGGLAKSRKTARGAGGGRLRAGGPEESTTAASLASAARAGGSDGRLTPGLVLAVLLAALLAAGVLGLRLSAGRRRRPDPLEAELQEIVAEGRAKQLDSDREGAPTGLS